ncbi:MAG TPA: hypothetical protein V6C71_12140 [Coleofasciculaceae cyanobacterium]|jgi:hypothetical protein
MLVNRYQTVYLSFISTDLPVWNVIEAKASLYQKDRERFHLLLNQQNLPHSIVPTVDRGKSEQGLFWLEISPYRVMMTMQSNGKLSYRHFWEKGIYGVSRYCLNTAPDQPSQSIRFRNFTRYLKVDNDPFPKNVRIEYEIWSAEVHLGSYILHLEIEPEDRPRLN